MRMGSRYGLSLTSPKSRKSSQKTPIKKKLVIEIGDSEQNEPGIEPEEEDNLLNPINERVLGEQN